MKMKPSDIILQKLTGLRNMPNPFPSYNWDEEFSGVDLDIFTRAIEKIRSTAEWFPTYSQVHTAIADVKANMDIKADSQGVYYCLKCDVGYNAKMSNSGLCPQCGGEGI
jgi:rubrerythrin